MVNASSRQRFRGIIFVGALWLWFVLVLGTKWLVGGPVVGGPGYTRAEAAYPALNHIRGRLLKFFSAQMGE